MTGLIITFALGIFIIFGALIAKYTKKEEIVEQFSMAIALVTLLCILFMDLIPEIVETFTLISPYISIVAIIAGVVSLLLLEKIFPDHEHIHDDHISEENISHIGIMSCFALILHNIVEGISVFSVANSSALNGVMVGIGVGLHNIPLGMFIYAALRNEKKLKRHIFMTLSVLSTFAGGLLLFILGGIISEVIIHIILCIGIGMIIYISLFELLPHIIREKNYKVSALGAVIGIAVIAVAMLLE